MSVRKIDGELLEKMKAEVARRGISSAQAAKEIGVSAASMNFFFKGVYPANTYNLEQKVKAWLITQVEIAQNKEKWGAAIGFVKTPTSELIVRTLSYVMSVRGMGMVYGAAGMGKTETAKRFVRTRSGCWLVTAAPSNAPLGAFLELIAEELGLKLSTRRCSVVSGMVVKRLKETQGMIVVDEAQHLGTRTLEEMRGVHDRSGIAVVLMGNELVSTQLGGVRAAAFAQLTSRLSAKTHVEMLKKGDAEAVIEKLEIANAQVKEALKSISKEPGGLRSVLQTMRLAGVLAKGKTPQKEHVLEAWENLSGAKMEREET